MPIISIITPSRTLMLMEELLELEEWQRLKRRTAPDTVVVVIISSSSRIPRQAKT